jgi:hypothetical protein
VRASGGLDLVHRLISCRKKMGPQIFVLFKDNIFHRYFRILIKSKNYKIWRVVKGLRDKCSDF